MRTRTDHGAASELLRRALPLIGLTLTTTIGTAIGLWMVVAATSSVGTVEQGAAVHTEASEADHAQQAEHPDQPDHAVQTDDAEPDHGELADHSDHAVQPDHSDPGAVPMPGLRELAVEGHSSGAHAPAPDEDADGRPLGATMAGFGILNLAVLLAASAVGRRGRRERPSRSRGGATVPAVGAAGASQAGNRPMSQSATAGGQS